MELGRLQVSGEGRGGVTRDDQQTRERPHRLWPGGRLRALARERRKMQLDTLVDRLTQITNSSRCPALCSWTQIM